MMIRIVGSEDERKIAGKIEEKLDAILEELADEYDGELEKKIDEDFEPTEEDIDDIFNDIIKELSKKELKPYQKRLQKEYWETKGRYDRLHKILIKFEADTLDFDLKCPFGLLEEQAHHMGLYLKCLEIRAEIEGVPLD